MASRIQLTGIKGTGPVWVWPAHITAVFQYARGIDATGQPLTCISVVGGRDPIAVTEDLETVLDMIDRAADGLLA
jgi:hypothetical protein